MVLVLEIKYRGVECETEFRSAIPTGPKCGVEGSRANDLSSTPTSTYRADPPRPPMLPAQLPPHRGASTAARELIKIMGLREGGVAERTEVADTVKTAQAGKMVSEQSRPLRRDIRPHVAEIRSLCTCIQSPSYRLIC